MIKNISTTRTYLYSILCLLVFNHCSSIDKADKVKHKIIIDATVSKYFYRNLQGIFDIKDEITLIYCPFPSNWVTVQSERSTAKVSDGKIQWVIYSDNPIKISPPFGNSVIMYPGDSLHIQYQRDYPVYSGSNVAALALVDSLMLWSERIVKPRKKHSYNVDDPENYNEWNKYLNDKLAIQLPFIEAFKDSITPTEYEYYKANLIGNIEADRLHAFSALYRTVKYSKSDLTRSDLVQIWDSTQNTSSRQWLNTLTAYDDSIFDIYTFVWMEIYKQAGFDTSTIYYKSKEVFTSTLYNKVKNNYQGKLREQLMAHILDEPTITEMGLKNPTTQALLKDYYSQPGYPEYKTWVKSLEKKRQQREKEKKKNKEKKANSKEELPEKQSA